MRKLIINEHSISPLLCIEYTDDQNHHLQAAGVGCYVGGAWVNSLSYADDMVLLAPTATALQRLLEVWRSFTGPHVIAYNTIKTICWLVTPKQLLGRYSTSVRLWNEELRFVEELRCLTHVMTADCRDDKNIKNNTGGKMELAICWSGSSHLHLLRQKYNRSSQIVTQFIDVLYGVIYSRTL